MHMSIISVFDQHYSWFGQWPFYTTEIHTFTMFFCYRSLFGFYMYYAYKYMFISVNFQETVEYFVYNIFKQKSH